jgi:hypothetical protein
MSRSSTCLVRVVLEVCNATVVGGSGKTRERLSRAFLGV